MTDPSASDERPATHGDAAPPAEPGIGAVLPDPSRAVAPPASASTAPPPAPALRHAASHVRFWTIAIAGLAIDLWSKEWAFRVLGQGGRRVLIPRVLEFQTMLNDGALFGIGSGQTTFFIVASIFALGLVLWMFAQSTARRWWMHVALGAILAGAVGNMYDRITVKLIGPVRTPGQPPRYFVSETASGRATLREFPVTRPGIAFPVDASKLERPVGHVRDFIKIPTHFPWGELWPWVFNVADMLLVGGVSILGIHLVFFERRPRAAPPSVAAALPEDSRPA